MDELQGRVALVTGGGSGLGKAMCEVLGEAGIRYDVSSDGTAVMVSTGSTGQARMLLAERGLPTSSNAGYELFDNVGSFGLTSFMQEVTRVRALEGEIGRSIQQIDGVAAARVHIVMPDVGNFRRGEQKPTASVMIRASTSTGRKSASSIRHLVASAVPGLDVDDVVVYSRPREACGYVHEPQGRPGRHGPGGRLNEQDFPVIAHG